MVILLTLVAGLAVAMFMERTGTSHMAAHRQASDYITRHAGLGMREMINRWLTTVRGKLKETLDEGGYAFSLDLPRGDKIEIYIRDAQGTVITDTSTVSGRRREILEVMNAYLDLLPEDAQKDARRQYGPTEVSIATANRDVLLALATAIVGPEKAPGVADALLGRRAEETSEDSAQANVMREQFQRTLQELDLEPEEIAELEAMVVYTPTLWEVTAEVRTGGGEGRIIERARGLLEINDSRSDTFNQNGAFLSWEPVTAEELEQDR